MKPSGETVVAFVPMRHHSVRVAGKNYRHLGGVPLFHHILRTLGGCPGISAVVIDTDSPVIREDVAAHFPDVRLIERPDHLCADDVPMNAVLCHDASLAPADLYVQTHSTNPFLKSATIERALACWRDDRGTYDSLFTVTRIQARLWDAHARPLNHDPGVLLRTQDLPPVYLENSNLYVFTPDLIRTRKRRIGDRPRLFEIDPLESLDIDDESGFALAERLIR
jgi:CMP-N-acetylneuraminic acid synthetase